MVDLVVVVFNGVVVVVAAAYVVVVVVVVLFPISKYPKAAINASSMISQTIILLSILWCSYLYTKPSPA